MGSELGFLDCFLHDPICGSDLILDEDSELGDSSSRVQNSGRFISDFDSENFGSDVNNKMDLLSTSLHENGLLLNQNSQQQNEAWNDLDTDTDALLDSILTGNDVINGRFVSNGTDVINDDDGLSARLSFEGDDGCSDDSGFDPPPVMSPHSSSQMSSPEPVDLQEILTGGGVEADERLPVQVLKSGLSGFEPSSLSSLQNRQSPTKSSSTVTKILTGFRTGTTTILLPVLTSKSSLPSITTPATKRRRISDSSSDSGNSSIDNYRNSDESVSKSPRLVKGKYPALILSEEEKRICERENVKLPSHYPLTREEEKNLKRIRRKIRNKVSAQDSRRRKKEYMDNMEERVKQCTEEKEELQRKIDQLETQNKTLAGQLRRLHQIIVNGGFRQNQTSTAMMVLLLSTALFLIPGFRDQHEGQKAEPSSQLDISRAIKMPPMPGQSRSLLQFNQIKQEFEETPDVESNIIKNSNNKVAMISNPSVKKIKEEENEVSSTSSYAATADHDYIGSGFNSFDDIPGKKKKKRSYIVEDVPPEGYGYVNGITATNSKDEVKMEVDDQEEVYFVTDEEVVISEISDNNFSDKNSSDIFGHFQEDRRLNVSVATAEGSGIRTIVLHVPKDIK